MEAFKDYIYSILIISFTAGIINIFAPEGSGSSNGIKKYLKYIIGLAVVLALLIPFKGILFTLPNMLKNNIIDESKPNQINSKIDSSTTQKWIITQSIKDICSGIKNTISQKYDISDTLLDVTLTVDDSDTSKIEIEKVHIHLLDKKDYLRANEIKIYIEKFLSCDTEVLTE